MERKAGAALNDREIDGAPRSPSATALVWVVLALAIVVRFLALDADPAVPGWFGHITDEGRWNEFSRNLVLFGRGAAAEEGTTHLTLSPAYHVVNLVVFKLAGVSFASARVLSALCGALVLLALVVTLRRRAGAFALLAGVVILGFESMLFSIGRLAIPEIPSALFMLLAFLVLVVGSRTPAMAFVAGLVAAVALGMKATNLLLVPALLIVALVLPREAPLALRVRRGLAFAGAFAVLVVVGLAVVLGGGLMSLAQIEDAALRSVMFIKPTGAYTLVTRLFNAPDLEGRNLLLLAFWFGSWAWFHRPRPRTDPVLESIWLGSAIWMGWWLFVFSANDYSPERYVVHFSVPAAFNFVAALSLGVRGLPARVATGWVTGGGVRRLLAIGWLCLPSAVFLAALVAAWVREAGVPLDRLVQQLALVAAALAACASCVVVALRSGAGERLVTVLLLTPLALAAAWLVAGEAHLVDRFWDVAPTGSLLLWTAVIVACPFLVLAARAAPATLRAAAPWVLLALVAGVWCARSFPPVLSPSYATRDAARDLTTRFPAGTALHAFESATVFLGNDMRYHELSRARRAISRPMLVLEDGAGGRAIRASDYARGFERTHAYVVPVGPRALDGTASPGAARIGVYVPR